MKKAIVPLIFLMLLAGMGALVTAQRPAHNTLPAEGQARLNQYIAYAYPRGTTSVQLAEKAKRPQNLTKDSRYAVFGDSVHYHTNLGPTANQNGGVMPLPYPPRELWCILLNHDEHGADKTAYAIVFAGLHMDMHNADWLIHQGSQNLTTPGLAESLEILGCSLELEQAGPHP